MKVDCNFGAILKPRGQNLGFLDPPTPYVVIFISELYLLMWFFGGPPSPPYCPRGLRMALRLLGLGSLSENIGLLLAFFIFGTFCDEVS